MERLSEYKLRETRPTINICTDNVCTLHIYALCISDKIYILSASENCCLKFATRAENFNIFRCDAIECT